MTPQCSNCGHINPSFASACSNCGTPLPGASPQPPPPMWGAPPSQSTGAPSYGTPSYGATPFGGMQSSMFGPGVDEAQKTARNALIAGIVSIVCCALAGIAAIKWGNEAKSALRAAGVNEGQGMATAGIVLGWIALVLWVLSFVVQIIAA